MRAILLMAAVCLGPFARPIPAQPASHVIEQTADGLLVIEAESHVQNVPASATIHVWETTVAKAGYSGTGAMATIDHGFTMTAVQVGDVGTTARMDYRVKFVRSGVHRIFGRGAASATDPGNADSFFIGVDGVLTGGIAGFNNQNFIWSSSLQANTGANTFNVPAPGEYTVNVWMREDGFHLDKFLFVQDDGFTIATGSASVGVIGPAESPRSEEPAPEVPPGFGALDLRELGTARQSSTLVSIFGAGAAIDGSTATVSQTQDVPGSYWELELGRAILMTRIELVPPGSNAAAIEGLVLRLFDLRDRVLFETTVTGAASGIAWAVDLPANLRGRILRFGLDDGPNGAGNHRVALAEVRVFGDPSPDYGPIALKAAAVVTQSSTSGANVALRAIDGDPATFSQTLDLPDSYFLVTLDRARPIRRVELVNPGGANAARMQGLTLRVLDDEENTVASATVPNPGAGASWGYDLPPGEQGRYVRVGLENGAVNGQGNRIVSLAEVNILTSTNHALGADSYMMRWVDTLPPTANANDGNYATHTKTTVRTVEAYWEVDLGEPAALYSVRVVAADGFQMRMTHATVRLYDGAHESVYSKHLGGTSPTFDVDLPGPVVARYVRVGFENKERSTPGITEWYMGIREVQAFGRPVSETGLLDFSAGQTEIASGGSTPLSWDSEHLYAVDLYPGIGSAGVYMDNPRSGQLTVAPAASTEYVMVGTNHNGNMFRFVTVEVDGGRLPPRISEFVASNRLSLRDGRNEAPDWIELHNPRGVPLEMEGYGLSDNPAEPMKWVFPPVTIAPHGYLIVCASGAAQPFDGGGVLHASFSLAAGGESVILTAPDGTRVDAVLDYPPQMEDLAYGRTLEGVWTFLEPTPGAPNLAPAYEGWLHPPVFSHERGFYTNAFALSLGNPNAGAELVYSLDGKEPSVAYANPLPIGNVATVRAGVRRAGYKPPPAATHTYVFLEGVIESPLMRTVITQDARYSGRILKGLTDLPTICIAVPEVPDDWIERPGSVEILWPDGSPAIQVNCGVNGFGGAIAAPREKKSYRLKFRAEYGARKLEAPLFRGFDRTFQAKELFDQLDLHSGTQESASTGFYTSSRFAQDLMLDMGSINPHGRFAHLYINGVYWGQYHVRERLIDSFLAEYLGGRTEDYVNVKGNDNSPSEFIPGMPEPPNRAQWDFVIANRGSYQSVKSHLDVRHFVDFMLMWFYGNSETEFRAAGPLEPGSGFKFYIADEDGYLRTSALNKAPVSIGPGGIFAALTAERDPDFMTLLADRTYKHFFNDGAMTPARNVARLNERMEEMADSMIAECARWNYRTPDSILSAAQNIRTGLFPNRTANLFAGLRSRGFYPAIDPPRFSQHGGSITNGHRLAITADSGTIYYTLDGSDPRLPGGGISPGANAWEIGSSQTGYVAAGSVWRYWDRGSLPAANWRAVDYDDSGWSLGAAPLGYGQGNEATVVSFGPSSQSKYTTTYFRRTFAVEDPSEVAQLIVDLARDDGAVVHLNGAELFRDNMPFGTIGYSTFAAGTASGADEERFFTFTLPPALLRAGMNVVAVEVHQVNLTSSDLRFDLALWGNLSNAAELTLSGDTLLRARLRSGTNWSAMAEAGFVEGNPEPPAAGDLLITEIHYNPAGSDDYEFLELHNRSLKLLDLSGARLTNGVEFLFPQGSLVPAGGFIVVVENAAAFDERYRASGSPYHHPGLLVAGEWDGRLSNEGERITLIAAGGQELLSVLYQTGGDWPGRADDLGSSIELRHPGAAPAGVEESGAFLSRSESWQASALYHGSPGRLDAEPPGLVISELLARASGGGPDWVELHNQGGGALSLDGFYLSDREDQPFRHALAEHLMIEGGGFLVLTEGQLGFAFSALGESVHLIQASGTNILRFVDAAAFPAAERDESFGRYARSDGVVDFTELRALTPLEANALPRVGPVVFSEIMYREASGKSEFVEIVNIGKANVPLYDPLRPANTWELSGAVRFSFPPGQELAPGGVAIVSAVSPETFRSQQDVPVSVPVHGPWTGALNNAGENLVLRRPGPPEGDGTIPYYRVDRVRYAPGAPWPEAANSGGVSLERMPLEAYGNDPAYWRASSPGGSPGVFAGNRPPTVQVTGETAVAEGEMMVLQVRATDPDEPWQRVVLSAEDIPAGGSFGPADGTFLWDTSGAGGPGNHAVRFFATDDGVQPATGMETIFLAVGPAGAPFSLEWSGGVEGMPRFTFWKAPGEVYEIHVTESLSPAVWRLLERIEAGVGGWHEVAVEAGLGEAQLFLRVARVLEGQ